MLGSRIKQGRTAAGLSLRELAQAVGLSAMAISKYERDQVKPSSEILLRLAKALSVRVEYFFRQPGVELTDVEFRKHAKLSAQDEAKALDDVREQLERWLELEAVVPASWPKAFALPRGLPAQVNSYDEVEALANRMRDSWQQGTGPIRNLMDKMEEEGIKVIVTPHDGGKKFDGLVAKARGHTVIVVGKDWPGDRQRFTLAHELGHLVLHGRLASKLDEERACNRFAGAFLVPRDEVIRLLGTSRSWLEPRELYLLKHEWGLSMNGWLHRAQDLGILNQSAARRHWQFFTQQSEDGTNWREREPGKPYVRECPLRFAQLVYRALAEDLVGESKAAELLGLNLVDLRAQRRMDATHAVGSN
jgi:Zn-dependent peptidase ImmA (M78 family)/transcriptional regulator with XRE-family HTH domain